MNKLLATPHSAHRPYMLVTGATGLLGQYLMRDLIRRGRAVAVIVRTTEHAKAIQRVNTILKRCESELREKLPRPIVIEGDVCRPGLGLSRRQIHWISENCNSILHNAASLQFHGSGRNGEPWQTNLEGTRRMIELARQTEIKNFHLVSTAYVCGKRTTSVLESELDCGQSFRNDYEHSKFAAELLVQSSHHLQSPTVYRPVVIAGDSRTGFTSTYHGIFLYLRLIATVVPMLKKDGRGMIETPVKLPLNGDEPRNLVPVDWVSEVMTFLIENPQSHGMTYHLSPDHCLTTKEFIDCCCEYFHTYGVQYVGSRAGRQADSELASRLFENVKIYEDYEANDPHFDKSNLLKFAGHLPCPRMDREMIFRFIKFGQVNRWGKRSRPVPIADASAQPEFSALALPNS